MHHHDQEIGLLLLQADYAASTRLNMATNADALLKHAKLFMVLPTHHLASTTATCDATRRVCLGPAADTLDQGGGVNKTRN